MCLHEINCSKGAPSEVQCKEGVEQEREQKTIGTNDDAAMLETSSESKTTPESEFSFSVLHSCYCD